MDEVKQYKELIERTTGEKIITPDWDCETSSYCVYLNRKDKEIKIISKYREKYKTTIDLNKE